MKVERKIKEQLKKLGKAAISNSHAWKIWYSKQQRLCEKKDQELRANRPSPAEALVMLSEIKEEPHRTQPIPHINYEPILPLSIIVPVYNVEKYLDQCLASILGQDTDLGFEVVAVDDGSTDGSAALLETWVKKDARVRVVHRENGGLSAARNTGIAESKGKYIIFVDSDDEMTPNAIASLMKGALMSGADFCSGQYVRINEDDEVISPSYPLDGQARYAWGRVYRRAVWERLCWPEGYWYEDTLFSILLETQFTGAHVPVDVYRYRVRRGSIVESTGNDARSLDGFWILRLLLDQARECGMQMDQLLYCNLLFLIGPTMLFKSSCLDEQRRQALFFACCDLLGRTVTQFGADRPSVVSELVGLESALRDEKYYSWLLECVRLGMEGYGIKPSMALNFYKGALHSQDC